MARNQRFSQLVSPFSEWHRNQHDGINYFDLDMSMLEPGYTFGFQFSFYEDSVGSYREQPHIFKFRIAEEEL